MTDEVEITFPAAEEDDAPAAPPAAPTARDIRLANLTKARAARTAKRTTAAHTSAPRTATQRTAADAGSVGVSGHPEAVARAELAREPVIPAEVFQRRPRTERTFGAFELPVHRKKPGWDYQWMAIRVLNEPVDRSVLRSYEGDGAWRAEKTRDWPELSDPSDSQDAPIEVRGQRLYGRPLSLTIEAKQEDLRYAQEQQRTRMTSAANGQGGKGEEGLTSNRLTRTVPIEIKLEGVAG